MAEGRASPGGTEGGTHNFLKWLETHQPVSELCKLASAASDAKKAEINPGTLMKGQTTYGEIPLRQLSAIFDAVRQHGGLQAEESVRFYDLGSGGGKLVLGAVILLGASCIESVGIELLMPLVEQSQKLCTEFVAHLEQVANGLGLDAAANARAAVRFSCADFLDSADDWAANGNIVLINGLCFPERVKKAICERLCERMQCGGFVVSTTPLPQLSAGRFPPFETVHTNAEDAEMDVIGLALGDSSAGASFWEDFCVYIYRRLPV